MQPHSDSKKTGKAAPTEPKRRIQTQIHRRKKAKAVFPLTDEWKPSSPSPPVKLRMPPENMGRR